MTNLIYERNPKHKRGCTGEGPPRWFPSYDSLCPEEIDGITAQSLLEQSIVDSDRATSNGKARYTMHEGEFFKAYMTETRQGVEVWHGFPVSKDQVGEQIPAKILRKFRDQGELSNSEYKKLVGSA